MSLIKVSPREFLCNTTLQRLVEYVLKPADMFSHSDMQITLHIFATRPQMSLDRIIARDVKRSSNTRTSKKIFALEFVF